MTGWQLAAILVEAPAPRTIIMVSPTSHHGQWSGVSFKISAGGKAISVPTH
jgi:hypothetical protein